MKYWVLIFSLFCNAVYASSSVTVTIDVPSASTTNVYNIFTITNNTDQTLKNWVLHFQLLRTDVAVDPGRIKAEKGYYYEVNDATHPDLAPHASATITAMGAQGAITHVTDLPRGIFISADHLVTNVKVINHIPEILLNQNEATENYLKNVAHAEHHALQDKRIVPAPVHIKIDAMHSFALNKETRFVVDEGDAAARRAANIAASFLRPATGFSFKIAHGPVKQNRIRFTSAHVPAVIGHEGYALTVDAKGIVIRAQSYAGFLNGIQSLRQLLPPEIFRQTVMIQEWPIPFVKIVDYPRYAYRGFAIDVARTFVPLSQLERMVDLMSLYKLNTLHLHLTDDEGSRFQSNLGAFRAFPWGKLFLPPATGSRFNVTGGYYSENDLRALIVFADTRHVTVVPEIDLPGHARALIKSLPQYFVDPEDHSVYRSVQGFSDNVLPACSEKTYAALSVILQQVASIFPSTHIHIGSDELPAGVWSISPDCLLLAKQKGWIDSGATSLDIAAQTKVHTYFVNRIGAILQRDQKIISGWQEMTSAGPLNPALSDTLVYVWTDLTATQQAAIETAQYPVVLLPATYLYFDMVYSQDYAEPGLHWTGTPVDTYQVYAFNPAAMHINTPIIGVEGALWGDTMTGQESYTPTQLQNRIDYELFPRMLALSEVAWTPQAKRHWPSFALRVGHDALPILDDYGVRYRLDIPGIHQDDQGIKMNTAFPGLAIHYTTDGSQPTAQSPLYKTDEVIKAVPTQVRAVTASRTNRVGRAGLISNVQH